MSSEVILLTFSIFKTFQIDQWSHSPKQQCASGIFCLSMVRNVYFNTTGNNFFCPLTLDPTQFPYLVPRGDLHPSQLIMHRSSYNNPPSSNRRTPSTSPCTSKDSHPGHMQVMVLIRGQIWAESGPKSRWFEVWIPRAFSDEPQLLQTQI